MRTQTNHMGADGLPVPSHNSCWRRDKFWHNWVGKNPGASQHKEPWEIPLDTSQCRNREDIVMHIRLCRGDTPTQAWVWDKEEGVGHTVPWLHEWFVLMWAVPLISTGRVMWGEICRVGAIVCWNTHPSFILSSWPSCSLTDGTLVWPGYWF